jgi:hypothetical protein
MEVLVYLSHPPMATEEAAAALNSEPAVIMSILTITVPASVDTAVDTVVAAAVPVVLAVVQTIPLATVLTARS